MAGALSLSKALASMPMRSNRWGSTLCVLTLAFAVAAQSQSLGVTHPGILPSCSDPPESAGVSPSARAVQCTREICARPEHRATIFAYAKGRHLSRAEEEAASACITRAQQDKASVVGG